MPVPGQICQDTGTWELAGLEVIRASSHRKSVQQIPLRTIRESPCCRNGRCPWSVCAQLNHDGLSFWEGLGTRDAEDRDTGFGHWAARPKADVGGANGIDARRAPSGNGAQRRKRLGPACAC